MSAAGIPNNTNTDIADFLKGNNNDDVLFNFMMTHGQLSQYSALTMMTNDAPPPPSTSIPPLRPCETSHGPDFSSLLFEGSSVKSEPEELLTFDHIDTERDSYSLFGTSCSQEGLEDFNYEDPQQLNFNGYDTSPDVLSHHGYEPSDMMHNTDWTLPHSNLNMMHPYNLQCGSCQILHCIIHSNGVQDTKLEIHGCDGQSYNAVLHTRFCVDDGFPATLEQQIVEFPVGNAEYVKQFLLQYSLLRRKEGFILRHDSTGSFEVGAPPGFPECINDSVPPFPKQLGRGVFSDLHCSSSGSDGTSGFGKHLMGQSKPNRSSSSMDSMEHAESSSFPTKPPKSNAAAQRERTGKLKMSDLAQHFHLPINAAAKELGICPTVLKKICRRNGMRRWPHRKIKSIERIIATLEQTIAEGAGQGDEGIRMEIAMLRNERAQLCAGLLGET